MGNPKMIVVRKVVITKFKDSKDYIYGGIRFKDKLLKDYIGKIATVQVIYYDENY